MKVLEGKHAVDEDGFGDLEDESACGETGGG